MIRNAFVSLRVFALFLFVFSPSMLLLVAVGVLTQNTWWFVFLGLPALIANGLVLFVRPIGPLIAAHLRTLADRR
jgi:hypothetical protein